MAEEPTTDQGAFAYGTDKTDGGCECPAVSAGFNPSSKDPKPAIKAVVERYDMNLASAYDEGVVGEQRARDAWMRAVQHWRERGYEYAVQVGEEVAEELGWMEACNQKR